MNDWTTHAAVESLPLPNERAQSATDRALRRPVLLRSRRCRPNGNPMQRSGVCSEGAKLFECVRQYFFRFSWSYPISLAASSMANRNLWF